MRSFFLAITILSATACTSGYQKYYNSYIDNSKAYLIQNISPDYEPTVYLAVDFSDEVRRLREKGYLPIGHSRYIGEYQTISSLKSLAKSVGASIVVTTSTYIHTEYDENDSTGPIRHTLSSNTEIYDQTAVFFAKRDSTATSIFSQQ